MLIDTADFWSWALERYQNPHTRDLLLALQESDEVLDEHALSSPRTAEQGRRPAPREINIHPAQDMVRPEGLVQTPHLDEGFLPCVLIHGSNSSMGESRCHVQMAGTDLRAVRLDSLASCARPRCGGFPDLTS